MNIKFECINKLFILIRTLLSSAAAQKSTRNPFGSRRIDVLLLLSKFSHIFFALDEERVNYFENQSVYLMCMVLVRGPFPLFILKLKAVLCTLAIH